jgi:hypothetical protein
VIIGKYYRRPVEVEAVQFTGEPSAELEAWLGDWFESWIPTARQVVIWCLHEFIANKGDWIVKGVVGDIRICEPEVFAATYEVKAT